MPQLKTELAGIETLLLTPTLTAMQDVQQRLSDVVIDISQSGTKSFEAGVRGSVANIKFLLDSARQFWARRHPDPLPSVQYSAGGTLVETLSESTFALEV